MTNKIALLIVLQCIVVKSFAQQSQEAYKKHMMDSIKAAYIDKLAFKNPEMRQFTFVTDYFGAGDINSELKDIPFFDARLKTVRYFANFKMPLLNFGRNSISSSFSANHQSISLEDVKNLQTDIEVTEMDLEKTVLSSSLQFSRIDSLFKKPIIYIANVSSIVDPETGQNQILFGGISLLTLRKTQKSSFAVGLVLTVDPTSPFPIIPFFNYDAMLNPHTELSLGITGVSLRRELSEKSVLTFSNSLGGAMSMFRIDTDLTYIPAKVIYSTLEIRSGLEFEYLFTKKMVFTVKGGTNYYASSKVTEQGKTIGAFLKNKIGLVPYAQVGISFLPFWKGLAN
ncbi:DUF6268 family outer membrane beta-barrel protein [Chondrinema litorale]|uniref:DUF6268 family outer membrane beta-barrel protein n=1 Tax=Chondrinema litorale TaxID=2994555 RepID=UPI00254295EB|nr:DUF6268 family outer membrane beta-barrel protein [Chondrinema litorale]UZR97767.1 DUF6268 family outer membrane beta-barrel protein [Chondrinema litorale]